MNTKLKVGIAAAIVAALVALIVLDQKTTPKDDQATHPSPGGDPATIVGTNGGAEGPVQRAREDEINTLLKKAEKEFGEKPSKASTGTGIKGSEEPNQRDIKPATNGDYVIKKDDTYETIALAKYGSKSYATMIAEANPGTKPTVLRPGKHIILPGKPERKEEAVVTKPVETEKSMLVSEPVPPKKDPLTIDRGQKVYTVQPGDTLSGISVKVYNTSRHYEKIYQANKDQIEDPNTLQVGAKLIMPDLPAKAASANTGTPGAGVVPTTNPAPSAVPAGAKTVQVAEGDRLWNIAAKFAAERKIGILDMIKLIVQANTDKQIRDDGSNLRAGWQLIIPE